MIWRALLSSPSLGVFARPLGFRDYRPSHAPNLRMPLPRPLLSNGSHRYSPHARHSAVPKLCRQIAQAGNTGRFAIHCFDFEGDFGAPETIQTSDLCLRMATPCYSRDSADRKNNCLFNIGPILRRAKKDFIRSWRSCCDSRVTTRLPWRFCLV
jgi:hypothetical protein